jgi:hypothetical protein
MCFYFALWIMHDCLSMNLVLLIQMSIMLNRTHYPKLIMYNRPGRYWIFVFPSGFVVFVPSRRVPSSLGSFSLKGNYKRIFNNLYIKLYNI